MRFVTTRTSVQFSLSGTEPMWLATFHLRVPGLHNVYNALAAIAVGFELDVPFDTNRRSA